MLMHITVCRNFTKNSLLFEGRFLGPDEFKSSGNAPKLWVMMFNPTSTATNKKVTVPRRTSRNLR
ncbi:hypothetical protein C5167_000274 [Papaver somniferum]|uniref:Uncharacterized protein n=1 Tax=Papaver somniferum TaxID=3469 RepID=A0A4Y7KVD6_PAPSO|nr:hypothetical protein C5167_000274 [Papaver somniferum]